MGLAVSVLLHLAFFGAIWAYRHGAPRGAPPVGTVELLMVERKGAQEAQNAGTEASKQPPASASNAASSQRATPPAASGETEAHVAAGQPDPSKKVPDTAANPGVGSRLQMLMGTDSDTNAEVIGAGILPASPDDRYRNRPPPYPAEAAARGEQGAVLVLIHVASNGTAAGAEVLETSGYPALDAAAVKAVERWHFHPAMKDGQPVGFDMPIRFDFRSN
jgi:periplasmic protein TonB